MQIPQLYFSRFLAVIIIVLFHYGRYIAPFDLDQKFIAQGNVLVSYFFMLSGFVLITGKDQLQKIKTSDFFAKRLSKIYPIYLLALLLTILGFMMVGIDMYYKIDSSLLSILLLQSWTPYALDLNSTGWFISSLMFFYLTFPFCLNYFSNKSLKSLSIFVLLLWIMTQLVSHILFTTDHAPSFYLYQYLPLLHWSSFLMGNLAGLIYFRYLKNYKKNYDLVIILLLILLYIIIRNPIINYAHGMLAIIFMPLIVLTAINNGYLTKLFSNRLFILLGKISFAIYILQVPVFIWGSVALSHLRINNTAQHFYIRFLLLIIISIVAHQYIQKPIAKLLTKKICPKKQF